MVPFFSGVEFFSKVTIVTKAKLIFKRLEWTTSGTNVLVYELRQLCSKINKVCNELSAVRLPFSLWSPRVVLLASSSLFLIFGASTFLRGSISQSLPQTPTLYRRFSCPVVSPYPSIVFFSPPFPYLDATPTTMNVHCFVSTLRRGFARCAPEHVFVSCAFVCVCLCFKPLCALLSRKIGRGSTDAESGTICEERTQNQILKVYKSAEGHGMISQGISDTN